MDHEMKPRADFTIETNVTVFVVRGSNGDVEGRFLDAREALGYCRTINVKPLDNMYQDKVDVIWINNTPRILGPEIRCEYVSPLLKRSVPPMSKKDVTI